MVRFIRYWIERSMEKPEERDEKIRKHVETVSAKSKEMQKMWAEPTRSPGYWLSGEATATTKKRVADAAGESISPYDNLLRDMDTMKAAKMVKDIDALEKGVKE